MLLCCSALPALSSLNVSENNGEVAPGDIACGGIKCNTLQHKLIDPPWSWRAGQAGGKCRALTQTINITGAGTHPGAAHQLQPAQAKCGDSSHDNRVTDVRCEYLSCNLIWPQLFSFQSLGPENMRHAAPIIQESVSDNSQSV